MQQNVSLRRTRVLLRALPTLVVLLGLLPGMALAQPTFSKTFSPATIGPGSTSQLTLTIDNGGGAQVVTELAFTDVLPAAITLADPAAARTDCGAATLTAPDGGTTVTMTDGQVSAGATCTIEVFVIASTPGIYSNTSGDLTSSAGNSGAATADLTVESDRPGFSKSFSPAFVPLGSRSRLTFLIDNTNNPNTVTSLQFSDELPDGLQVADPSASSSTCTGGEVTAPPGSATVSYAPMFSGDASIAAGASCTVSVDVVATGVGSLDNVSSNLQAASPFFTDAGFAVATLDASAGDLVLIKEFLADPVAPGATVTLDFTILNRNRSVQAVDVNFTDDLDATLSGLVAVPPLPADPCGGGSTLSGTSVLTLNGGTLAPGGECTFAVTLQVPAGATPGVYPNTTSNIQADFGFGEPSIGNAASDDLFVFSSPRLEKRFLDDPVAPGSSTGMEFTITNTSATDPATDIEFSDDLGAFLNLDSPVSALPANGFCGGGSVIFLSTVAGSPVLNVLDANLAAGGSCTFQVTLDLPAGYPGGVYTNRTSTISATVGGDAVTGQAASADLEVVSVPRLQKTFTNDPVRPGENVTLQFSLEYDEFAADDATSIAFTDDLDATLTGLTALGLPMNDACGTGSQLSGTSSLALTGGSLAPGESCTFDVTLQVPAGATPGVYTNTTSPLDAASGGLSTTGLAASDDLIVNNLVFTKRFVDDPYIAGATGAIEYTIENVGGPVAADLAFTDNLSATLSALSVTGAIPAVPCGAGSSVSGATTVVFSGGSLAAGESCTFQLSLAVPGAAADGSYGSLTSQLSATIDGTSTVLPGAFDTLVIDSAPLLLSKQFVDDPVAPGNPLTMRLSLSNGSTTEAIAGISLTDDVAAALAGTTVTGSSNDSCGFTVGGTGTDVLALSGGSLSAGGTCAIDVVLQIPSSAAAGQYTNTTSTPSGSAGGLSVAGNPASANFRVINVTFDKSFDGPTPAGGAPTLGFTITNNDPATAITGLAFTDDLSAVLGGLAATGLPLSGICGSGSSIGGSSFLTFTGGSLGPGESCTFGVPLAVPAGTAPGSYVNVTSDLTSAGLFAATPASANLSVEPAPTFAKVFDPNAIAVGGVTTLTFTIDNTGSAVAANDLSFSDPLPAGLAVAPAPNAASTCGGAVTAAAGSATIGFSGGSVAAGETCTVSVDVTGNTDGTFTNTSGALTSSSGDSGTASDTIDVVADEFGLTKSFRTAPVLAGGLVEMELSIVNNSAFPLTDIALTDDLDAVLPGLAAEGLPANDECGTGSQVAGTGVVSLTGGNLAAGTSCTVVVPVRVPVGAAPGSYANTTSEATANSEGVAVTAPPASANLEVAALTFTKTLSPVTIAAGDPVTATFTLDNPDPANALTDVAFSDDLDAFLAGTTATNLPLNGACGSGSLVDGTSMMALSGGNVAAGGSCSFQLTLSTPASAAAGNYTNRTSTLDATVAGTAIVVPTAEASLEVVPPPAFSKAFAPATVVVSQPSTLTFAIDNAASTLPAESLSFTDNLPATMQVADPANAATTCSGGSISAPAGATTVGYSGGSVAAGGNCTVSVDVVGNGFGTLVNTSESLTSTLGDSGTATATLTVGEDSDGVPGAVEDGAPNGGDGNGDGIADGTQNDVASLPTIDGGSFITVEITSGCDRLENVQAFGAGGFAASPPNGRRFPAGLVGFEMPCENAVVDVIFHGGGVAGEYYKFGPTTPGDPGSAAWYDFTLSTAGTGATFDGNRTWTLTLADNARGDATGDDGRIVDPGGPSALTAIVPVLDPRSLALLALLIALAGWHALTARRP